MRDTAMSRLRWSDASWILLLAFLALPRCALSHASRPTQNLNAGALPHSGAIFCDIEESRRCPTGDDLAIGIRLRAAALALNTGQTSTIGLDESPEALARCGHQPEVVVFRTPFPAGMAVCLNCGVIGSTRTYANPTAACVAKCTDIAGPMPPAVPPSASLLDECQRQARASANLSVAAPNMCFAGACTDGGMALTTFTDPRRAPEPVEWTDLIGVTSSGNTLTRTAPTSGDSDAGAVSTQWIAEGDAYVEMEATATNVSHVAGLAEIPRGCGTPCPDTSPGLSDITFAISLADDGNVYIIEGGMVVASPGAYAVGERYRLALRDNSDGTAAVTYSRLTGICIPGSPCPVDVLYAHLGSAARYPLRVDTSFFHAGSTLANVTLVRMR